MTKPFFIALIFIFCAARISAQAITVPAFDDKYSNFVKQLEAGNTNIDYREFRESFIESKQFKLAHKQSKVFSDLEKEMYVQIDKENYKEIIKITKKMLSIDYTSMMAHKILQQTYKILGDSVNRKKYHDIEFGLLNSIINSGDGKTCATGWSVIQIEEEYFILKMRDAHLKEQALINNKEGVCDKMTTETDKGEHIFYFDVHKVFEGYKKLGI